MTPVSLDEFMYSTGSNRLIGNIRNTIKTGLSTKYGVSPQSKTISKFMKLHGVHPDNFDFLARAEDLMQTSFVNTKSIDDNSNKESTFVKMIMQEVSAPIDKAIGFDYLYRMMKTKYGKKEAKRLTGEMYDLSLGLADSTNILKVYCWSMDASKLIFEGRPWGQLPSAPAQHVHSYISALTDTIHEMSNHLAGAIAIGSFFLDVAYILLHREGKTIDDIKTDLHLRKYLNNEFQQFIYSVNHTSRDGAQSPFTNVSIFDNVKLTGLVKDMSHMFGDYPVEYYVDVITEVQNVYMDLFEQGDKVNGGRPFRFPVTTTNFSKAEGFNKDYWYNRAMQAVESSDYKQFIDEAMLELVSDPVALRAFVKRDVTRYNVFSSKGTKVASCCRLINDVDMMDEFGSSSNSFGGSGVSLGSHRVVTINFNRIALECSSSEEYFKILDGRIVDAAKILSAHKDLIAMLTEKGLQPFIDRGWINPNRLFSTFGVMGLYEATETIQKKFGYEGDLTGDSLTYLNSRMTELSKEMGIMGNIEQIPNH